MLWREICTRAYGRKMIFVKLAYFVLAGFILLNLSQSYDSQKNHSRDDGHRWGFAFASLSLVSLILVNAQAVTSLTSERDAQDAGALAGHKRHSPRVSSFGKLGGSVCFNAKEVIIVPLFLLLALTLRGEFTLESVLYVVVSFLVLVAFSAMVGLARRTPAMGQVAGQPSANSPGDGCFFLFRGDFSSA